MALPHDAQRILTRLREQEALNQERQVELFRSVSQVLKIKSPKREDLEDIRKHLMATLDISAEKVALAQSLHQTVQYHVGHLEDEICCFEEEVRLARKYGELEDEMDMTADEGEDEDEDENRGEKGDEGKNKVKGEKANGNGDDKRNSGEGTTKKAKVVPSPAQPNNNGQHTTSPTRRRPRRSDPNIKSDNMSNGSKNELLSDATNPKSPKQNASGITAGDLEPTYCYCNQVSFGEMIGCDNPDCELEWFHYGCVGLTAPPPGKWYCPDCSARDAKILKRRSVNQTTTTTTTI